MTALKIASMTLVVCAAATQLNAAEAPATRARELRAAQQKLAWSANQTKGSPRQLLLMEQRKLDGLIDDLEHGKALDPAEIDRALERSGR